MGALLLDGVDDYLSFSGTLPVTDEDFTLAVWFKTNSTTSTYSTLIALGSSTEDWELRHNAIFGTKRIVAATNRAGDPSGANATADLALNTWHSATGVFAANNDRRAFGNGTGKGTDTANWSAAGTINRLYLGRPTFASTNLHKGHLAYAFLWSGTLSDADVSSWHGGDLVAATLVGAWDFTVAPVGGVYADLIGSVDLTVNGATFDSGETYTGQTYSFGATEHFGAASLEITDSITVAAKKDAKAATAVPVTASIATAAKKDAKGAAAVPVTFTVATAGSVGATGAASLEVTASIATAGVKTANGAAALPVTFTVASAATKNAHAAAALPITLGVDTSATKNAHATLALPITFDVVTAGEVSGAVDGAVDFVATFGSTTAAVKDAHAATDLPVTFAAATAATRDAHGALDLPITFTVATSGEVGTPAVTGAASLTTTFNADTAAVRDAHAVSTTTVTLDVSVAGHVATYGSATLPIIFNVSVTAEGDLLAAIDPGTISRPHTGRAASASNGTIARATVGRI